MAEIFRGKALDLHGIERDVVIKRILPHIAASPEFVEMLVDEAKIAVQLSHGNFAQVYDLGKVADDYFIVMEYVEGKTISQIMKRLKTQGKLMSIPSAVSICADVANGLDYMHRKTDESGTPLHIVHRDISPQNVIVSTAGTVKIIDFGIAKAKTKVSTTDSGILKGKFAYMSPEHAEGERLDHRTDIFSLGVILFELLTGQRLFKGKNNPDTIKKVKRARVPTPSELRSAIPKSLDEIVLKALQKDRDKRYQTAHDLAQDLTKFLVTRFPDFSPRELVKSLREIFPEMAPAERLMQEETPIVPIVIKKEEEPHEETAAADSALLRAKLKETEVFDVPEKKKEEAPPIEEEKEEGTDRILRLRRSLPILGRIAAAGLIFAAGLYAYRNFDRIERQIKTMIAEGTARPEPEPQPEAKPPEPAEPIAAPTPMPPSPPLPSVGTLVIDSQPKGARIFLDDADLNRLTPATLENIPVAKIHKLGLHLEKYRFWEGKVQLEAGKISQLTITLEPNYGDLEINSLPEGAEVILNGQPVGKTPFSLSRLLPDAVFEVEIRREGYEPWQGRIKIFGGKREVVNASLRKARPDETLP
jgi:serine/threonine protein kinase